MKEDTHLTSTINGRVHHLENYQKKDSQITYPCIVYEMIQDTPVDVELSGNSGVYETAFLFTCISRRSDDLRLMADNIKEWSSGEFNESIIALPVAYPGFGWVDYTDDSEANEFAAQLQEQGYKTTQVMVSITNARC